jgi:soluble lytic murein transglycosylase
MGGTAVETARRWEIPEGPLTRVDRNISLGVAHLRDLFETHDWSLVHLLAAYNAGAEKAAEWAERFADPDLCIERIGWWETRAYVRHVVDGYWKYRETYRAEAAAGTSGVQGDGQIR